MANVEKETGTCIRIDKTDKGWFQGWSMDWLSGVLWKPVNKAETNCYRVEKIEARETVEMTWERLLDTTWADIIDVTWKDWLYGFFALWVTVGKETGVCTKVDKDDKGWFTGGWYADWLSGVLWKKVVKIEGSSLAVEKFEEHETIEMTWEGLGDDAWRDLGDVTWADLLYGLLALWIMVEKGTGTCTRVDKSDEGWFKEGWFTDWFKDAWKKVEK